jgi:hypothetical protein
MKEKGKKKEKRDAEEKLLTVRQTSLCVSGFSFSRSFSFFSLQGGLVAARK